MNAHTHLRTVVCFVFLQAKLLSRLLDAANGLMYLHGQGVIHGDLKAANVLLQHSGQPYSTVSMIVHHPP